MNSAAGVAALGRHSPAGSVLAVDVGTSAGDWEVWHTSLHNPDFSRYAEISGALGTRVTDATMRSGTRPPTMDRRSSRS